jgi:hypothetical protein
VFFLPNFAIFDIVGRIDFSKNKSLNLNFKAPWQISMVRYHGKFPCPHSMP